MAEQYKDKKAVCFKRERIWCNFSYSQLLEQVDKFANGLIALGLKTGDRVAIMSENCPEWLITDLAVNKICAISVPIHATSKNDYVEYVIEDADCSVIVISISVYEKYTKLFNDIKKIKIIVVGGTNISSSNNFYLIRDVLELGMNFSYDDKLSHELASILYTSGSTGVSKGVMLSNGNFLSNIESASKEYEVDSRDIFLSFLPLSHALERTLGSLIPVLHGCTIFYSQGIKFLKEDLKVAKPTVLIGVPKIFERFYEGVRDDIDRSQGFKKKLFRWALKNKTNIFADIFVFGKIRKLFGGNIRFCVSGGASLNPQILKFFLNSKILISEGYGLTETSPIISANRLDAIIPGSVGKVIPGVQVKIANNKEILVKGPNVMLGYWRKDSENKEIFDKDGWLHTGDLGHLDKEGLLTIIGRIKDIIVTTNGKNIAPEKLENLLNLSPYILQSLIVGHKRSNIAALLVINQASFKKGDGQDINSIIKNEIDKINENLDKFEWIMNYKVINDLFKEESGELTPTLKLRRFVIEDKYKKIINSLF